jgi:hypothetical protein
VSALPSRSRPTQVTSNGIVTLTAPAQADRLGNTGASGSVTVRVDKAKPTISAAQTKNADGTTTVTFTCEDSNSGGGEASGIATCLADGSTTNSKTVQPGVTVTGTATDRAGNTSTATSTAPAGDTTAPTLSGVPTTQPNGNGWYKGDVTIDWTGGRPGVRHPDPARGHHRSPARARPDELPDRRDGAGLSTTATSPAVKIDRTAPATASAAPRTTGSTQRDRLALRTDNLSGVASTSYKVDGGAAQTGTSFTFRAEGTHTSPSSALTRPATSRRADGDIKIDKDSADDQPRLHPAQLPERRVDQQGRHRDVHVR